MRGEVRDGEGDDIIADVSDFYFSIFLKSFVTFVISVQIKSNQFLKFVKIIFIQIYYLGIFLHKLIYQNTLRHLNGNSC